MTSFSRWNSGWIAFVVGLPNELSIAMSPLSCVERLHVLLRLVAGVLDRQVDLPAVDAAAGVERVEVRLVAGGDGLAERRGGTAERVEVADADRLGADVDAGAGLDGPADAAAAGRSRRRRRCRRRRR